MYKEVNVGKYGTVRLPDTFLPAVIETNKRDNKALTDKEMKKVRVYFGANMDMVVCVANNKELSKDNQERIRILTDVR